MMAYPTSDTRSNRTAAWTVRCATYDPISVGLACAPLLRRRRAEGGHVVAPHGRGDGLIVDEPAHEDDRHLAEQQVLNPVVDRVALRFVHRPVCLLEQTVHLGVAVPLVVF